VNEELHKLGEVLRAAREQRGVDLARVERDTKIRSRYLSALESGDYQDLPGAVYTRGFLRNYGLYLGLDPEYLTDLYRLETNGTSLERASPAPPRPIAIRRTRAFVVTPGAIAAALLTVIVVAIVGYIGYELFTFAGKPQLRIDQPVGDLASYGETTYTIVGVAPPNATITVEGLGENPVATADAQGHFSVVVKLVPGSNVITISAYDPLTKRTTDRETRTIMVDLGGPSPTPGSGALALVDPRAGAAITGPVRVTGTATAGTQIHLVARLVTAGTPRFTITTQAGAAVKIPAQSPGQQATGTTTAGGDGKFATNMALAPGTWDLSATPGNATGTTAVTRRIIVQLAAGLAGAVQVTGSPSYVLLLLDNVALAGVSGHVLPGGKDVRFTAKRTIVVRAGNAASVRLTVNGIALPPMGGRGEVVEWHITFQ
jgi:transcriptional regulator with XRE-family HTH domain